MATLGNPKNTIDVLNRHGIYARKQFGQNFLIDEHVLHKIVAAAGITKDDFVLEIGPGIGTLTQYLCEAAGAVCAVEIDRDLLPVLAETLAPYENVTVINEDIMKTDIAALIAEKAGGRLVKVAANLPYYITTPILMRLLEERLPIESITVMIQKEVAQRMAAAPGTKDYGALSLAVQYYTVPYLAANVPPNCFLPRPSVASAVIRLDVRKEPAAAVKDPELMFRLIRAAFMQRRKTLLNSLRGSSELSLEKEEILSALRALSLPEDIRGERLDLSQFAALADVLTAS